jgi:voltage-gated sodium channel
MKSISRMASAITLGRYFKGFIFILILLSAVIIGLETYPGIVSQHKDLLHLADRVIILLFTVEIVLKILAGGSKPWQFFRDPWNVFDFVIVAVCLIPAGDTHYVAVLRILRVLRVLRMVTFFPDLRLIVGALLRSLPSMGFVMLLIAILFYVYAIVGVFLFGQADPVHFGDLHHAMVTLFQVLTLEGWAEIMDFHLYGEVAEGGRRIVALWPFIYFSSFILIGAMIIMNLIIGIIMNSMEKTKKEMSWELAEVKQNDRRADELLSDINSKLDDLQEEIRIIRKLKDSSR